MAHRRFAPSLLPLIALIAACGGSSKGCSCTTAIPGGFPAAQRHENALQVRVSDGALKFLEQNGPGLVSTLLPGMKSSFAIPPSCGKDPELCCDGGKPGVCDINIDVKGLQLNPTPPNTLNFTVTTALTTPMAFTLKSSILLGSTCLVSIDTTKGKKHQAIDLTSSVTFEVDPMTDLTSINLANTTIANLDSDMIDIQGKDIFQIGCGLAQLANALNLLTGTLTSTLGGEINNAVGPALCTKCMTQADCSSFADACTGGTCMRGKSCLQEVGLDGKMNLGSLLGSIAAGSQASMDVLAVLGGYAEATANPGGLSLGLLGGGLGDPHNACVPMRPAPAPEMVSKWAQEMGPTAEVEPANMLPYHVGIGIHESELNQLAWAAFDGGALCLNVGTATVAQLDAATIGVLIPSLNDLTDTRDSPLFLVLRPQQEPHITIGPGTFNVDMNGVKTIKDPLLNVALPSLQVDFYAFVDERYVRVMTLGADVALGVSLDADDKGNIVPMIGDLSKAFSNVTITNNELLSEDPKSLAKAFPTLLGAAAGALGNLKGIALPAIMGLTLKIVAIEPTDSMKFLGIFANLGVGMPDAFHATTLAEVTRVIAPPTAAFRVEGGLDPARTPQVELALSGRGQGGNADDLEWSVNLDDTFWTPYSSASKYLASDPRLWLQGRHFVLVRARVAGDPSTTDPAPVRLDFLVDTIAPTGEFDAAGNELVISAQDLVSPTTALVYRYRVANAAWSDWTGQSHITLAGAGSIAAELAELEVQARDEAGNIGAVAFHGRTTAPATSGGCGCDLGGRAPAPTGALLLSVIGMLLAFVRRSMFDLQRSKAILQRSKSTAQRSKVVVQRSKVVVQRHLPGSGRTLILIAAAGVLVGTAGACSHDDSGTGMPDGGTTMGLSSKALKDPQNEVGRFSDAVAHSGTIYVSAYDDSTGDLAYAEVAEASLSAPIQWQWVDGVPVDEMPDNGTMYRGGYSDDGDDVGEYSSIAVDANGDARIAYFDVTHGALKYAAAADHKFTTSFVDMPAMGAGTSGLYASITLDASGIPSIAYAAISVADGKGGFAGKLRVATANSAKPAGPSDWKIVDVDSEQVPCAGLCAKGQVCIQTDMTSKAKSVCKAPDVAACPMACSTTQACIGAACVAPLVAPKVTDFVEGTGLYANLLRSPMGTRAIAYYDREAASLKLASESAGSFATSFIDGMNTTSDVGQFAAAMYAPDGTLHIAYVDAVSDQLVYRTVQGGTPSAMVEVIDDGMRADQKHPVGAGAALWTDGKTIEVVYQDQRTSDLWLAVRGGAGWTKMALRMGSAGYGFYPHIINDADKVFLTQFVYDRAQQMLGMPLGALQVTTLQ